MNLNKHLEFFNPQTFKEEIHLVGVGAIGSNILNQLVRLGFSNIHIYDFDIVNQHNITKQLYTQEDIGKFKVDAIKEHMLKINPNVNIVKNPEGWNKNNKNIKGILISALDSINTRRELFEDNKMNFSVKAALDMRIGLEEAQMYFANWSKGKEIKTFLSTMQYDDSEVVNAVSACGTTLSVLPTIQMIVSIGVMNLLNFLKQNKYNNSTFIDSIKGIAKSY